jgi:hypothetical protein
LGGEQALDFTPDEQASQPPDIALGRVASRESGVVPLK